MSSRRVLASVLLSVLGMGALVSTAHAVRPRPADLLLQRMAQSEQRLVQAGADAERQTALREMETVMVECARTRGCDLPPLLVIYRRGLEPPKPAQGDAPVIDDEAEQRIDHASDSVPGSATADALLDDRNRRFLGAVQFNPAVQAGIRRWLTDMRPALMASYENYQYLRPLMAPAFERAGLPEALLFGILAKESNGKVHVGSRAGAIGPLQFMPATGRRFGLGDDGSGFDTRYDARAAAEAAAAYLLERYRELNNSIELSLAAYNGGEGRALRAYQSSGGRNFWDSVIYDSMPAETRDYVPMVIAAAWLFLHPSDYGVRFPQVANMPARLQLERAASLSELSICLGNQRGTSGYLRALRNLNPRLQPDALLPVGTVLNATTMITRLYPRYCVTGDRARLVQQLMASDARTAVVRIGPVESAAGAEGATPAASPAAPPVAVPAAPAAGPVRAPRAATPPSAAPRARTHRVARGESLHQIADRYGCRIADLARGNGVRAPRYALQPGQVLRLQGCRSD